jgi:hypothetical protein
MMKTVARILAERFAEVFRLDDLERVRGVIVRLVLPAAENQG